ncbi:MAG: hypothetical protein KC505_08885 [Myxococcales bacterium]|nr:hypothetical protein [Myxococcales bacterium]
MRCEKVFYLFFANLISIMLLGLVSCRQSAEQEKLNQYLDMITAAELATPPGGLGMTSKSSSPATTIVGGTPRLVTPGVCGDGIINGINEDCDKGAVTNPNCSELGGISGTVRCSENCLYDLSDCITPAVNTKIGGVTENCKCNCSGNQCNGGCAPASSSSVGQSRCRFDCDNQCVCKCEGKLEAHLERCDFTCLCDLNASGSPVCDCSLESCDVLTAISPNIANIISR